MAAPLPPQNSDPGPLTPSPASSGVSESRDRRESDSTGTESGIRSGGRRASDRGPITKRPRYLTIAIIASFLFSGGVLLWAFTMPFRHSDRPMTLPSESVAVDYRDPEATMTNKEFIANMMREESELQEELARKYKPARNLPDLQDTQMHWQQSKKRIQGTVETLLVNVDGAPEKGTLEWQTIEDLKSVLEDAPPDRYRNRQPER